MACAPSPPSAAGESAANCAGLSALIWLLLKAANCWVFKAASWAASKLASAAALGLGLNVFISISLKEQSRQALATFEQRIAEHDAVMECYLMTGDSDYLIRVVVRDMADLEKFILEQLTPIPGIEKIRSSFALKQVRYKTALPLPAG